VGRSLLAIILIAASNVAFGQAPWYSLPPAPQTGLAISPPVGVQIELLSGVYPAMTVVASRASNPLRTENGEPDTIVWYWPSIVYRTSVGRHEAQIGYSGIFKRYQKFDDQDTDNQIVDAGLDLDISERLDVNLQTVLAEGSETRGAPGTPLPLFPLEDPNEFDSRSYFAEAIYGRRTNTIQLSGAIVHNEVRYTNNDQQARDRDRDSLRGRIYYNVAPSTSLFAQARVADIDYQDPTSVLDNTETAGFLGVLWEATEATFGEAMIGRLDKDFNDPSEDDFDGTAALLRADWLARPFTRVRLYASRTTEETSDPSASFFVSNLIGAAVEHEFTSRWTGYMYLNRTKDEFSNDRQDRFTDFGIGFDYDLTRLISLGVLYGDAKRSSNDPRADFDDEFVSIIFSIRR